MKIPSLINNSAVESISNLLSIAIEIFDQYPGIINIKKKHFDSVLNFKKDDRTEVEKVINNFSIHKACQKDGIPTKVIKTNKDNFAGYYSQRF